MRKIFGAYFCAACVALAAGLAAAQPAKESEAARLRAEIRRHDELYFQKNSPEISDAAYDALKRRLAELEGVGPESPGGESREFGDDRTPGATRRRHLAPMGGLDKAYTEAQLRRFHADASARVAGRAAVYVVEPKYDGLAVSVTYESGRLVCAATRGDGVTGEDVTAKLLAAAEVPRRLTRDGVPARVELRGEAYLRTDDFQKLNRALESAGESPFTHPRTAAAALLRTGTGPGESTPPLRVVFFGLGAWQGEGARPATQRELLAWLAARGLPVPEPVREAISADDLVAQVREMGRMLARFGFPSDGAVVKLDALAGEGRRAVAYKFETERARTVLTGIECQVGRTGIVTPVARLVPVTLGGANVRSASLHNAAEIARRDLRVGDTVWVEKAGEVIPVVTGPVLSLRPPGASPFVFPARCPGCESALVPEGDSVVRCANAACPGRLARGLEHFASRGALGIAGLGPALADKLVASGRVKRFDDLYRLSPEGLAALDGVGVKTAAKLHAAIAASRRAPLWRFIVALGLPETGPAAAKKLADRYGSLAALARMSRDDLAACGLGESAQRALLAHFAREENRAQGEALHALGCGVFPVRPEAARESGPR